MTRTELRDYLRAQPWAIETTITTEGAPRAAVIGVAITDSLELIFDALRSSRKHASLQCDARIALVVGWDDARTAQIEGLAERPTGADLERVKEVYFARFPDGRKRANLSEIVYWRVRPTWIRFSDFREYPPTIMEWDAAGLASTRPDTGR